MKLLNKALNEKSRHLSPVIIKLDKKRIDTKSILPLKKYFNTISEAKVIEESLKLVVYQKIDFQRRLLDQIELSKYTNYFIGLMDNSSSMKIDNVIKIKIPKWMIMYCFNDYLRHDNLPNVSLEDLFNLLIKDTCSFLQNLLEN